MPTRPYILDDRHVIMRMNKSQRYAVWAAAGAIAGLLLYPPFLRIAGVDYRHLLPGGHNWFWSVESDDGLILMNWPVLLTMWLGVLIVGALVYWLMADE